MICNTLRRDIMKKRVAIITHSINAVGIVLVTNKVVIAATSQIKCFPKCKISIKCNINITFAALSACIYNHEICVINIEPKSIVCHAASNMTYMVF